MISFSTVIPLFLLELFDGSNVNNSTLVTPVDILEPVTQPDVIELFKDNVALYIIFVVMLAIIFTSNGALIYLIKTLNKNIKVILDFNSNVGQLISKIDSYNIFIKNKFDLLIQKMNGLENYSKESKDEIKMVLSDNEDTVNQAVLNLNNKISKFSSDIMQLKTYCMAMNNKNRGDTK